MTRRDYVAIAGAFASVEVRTDEARAVKTALARSVAAVFASSNRSFDVQRFLVMCGLATDGGGMQS